MAKKGKRYIVKSDDMDYFKPGEIVIALQDDEVPYCVREDVFLRNNKSLNYYEYFGIEGMAPLENHEIEEIG